MTDEPTEGFRWASDGYDRGEAEMNS